VHLQTRSIAASECITKFTWSRCGETLELDCRQAIINTLPHLAWHPKGIHENERFWLEEHRKRVRGSTQTAWIYQSSAKVHETNSGKDRACISYIEMMSTYPGVTEIFAACR